MKDTFLVPVHYILTLLLVTVVTAFSLSLFIAVAGYDPGIGIIWKALPGILPGYLHLTLPVIVSVSMLLVQFRITGGRRGKGIIPKLVLAALAFITLMAVSPLLPTLQDADSLERTQPPVLITDQITITDDSVLYIEDSEGPFFKNLFIKSYKDPEGSFIAYGRAILDGQVLENSTGAPVARFSSINPVFENLYISPPQLTSFFDDIRTVAARFSEASRTGGSFRLLVFGAFVLFCLAIHTAGGISGWPFINVCLSLTLYRFFFFLYRVTTNQDVKDFTASSLSADILPVLPEVMLLALSAVLLLLYILQHTGKRSAGESKK